jgi:hypothetical protein
MKAKLAFAIVCFVAGSTFVFSQAPKKQLQLRFRRDRSRS